MSRRRLPIAFLAVVAAVTMLGVPVGPTAPAEIRAATPDLTIVSSARYEVQPDDKRVRVTLDLTLTNRLKDTKTKRYFFDEAFLAVLPGASGFKLTTGTGSPSVRATKKTKQYTLLRLGLARRLYSGKSVKYKLRFDLKDPGGAATRDLRIGDSLVSFPVWAFATDSTAGSSVRVVFPKGYDVEVEAGEIPAPTTDDQGRTVFTTGKLSKPLTFFAYLVADRPGAYETTNLSMEVLDTPVSVVLRSWSDDAPWATRVGDLLERALPEMGDRIGIAWPHETPLTVQEAVSRSTGGYAGLFDPSAGKVEIAYYAGNFVVLHEAAHGWFNGALLADRWASEAFASYYAEEAAIALDLKSRGQKLDDKLRAARIPLNAWGPVGTEAAESEDYAYAASLELAKAIAERAGDDGLRAVWADATAGVGAYQPPASDGTATETSTAAADPERVEGGPPDWRGLLDLLEARTDASYEDLWRTWVARPEDLPLLKARADARALYETTLTTAADWQLPRPIREALRSWRFDDATALLDEAQAMLAQRTALVEAAEAAGLETPEALRAAFEDDDGFDDASAEAAAELEAIHRYAEATALRPAEVGPLMALGLWGETPEADLTAAHDAFARGDLATSAAAADEAAATWNNAASIGQGRAISIGVLVLAAVFALVLLIAAIRRRRRPRTDLVPASAAGSAED
ncbi:MAG TPA: hypothetical protein VD763_06080 [Candidatus Saccharimonadales bacterium]|nr:hypothetical protein [Candidatus Saccharimonadales bacterium]